MRGIITTAALAVALGIAFAGGAPTAQAGQATFAHDCGTVTASTHTSCPFTRNIVRGWATCPSARPLNHVSCRRRVYSPVTRRWYRISYTYYTDGSLPDYIYGVGPNGQWAKWDN
jgi:hypothetical protein